MCSVVLVLDKLRLVGIDGEGDCDFRCGRGMLRVPEGEELSAKEVVEGNIVDLTYCTAVGG